METKILLNNDEIPRNLYKYSDEDDVSLISQGSRSKRSRCCNFSSAALVILSIYLLGSLFYIFSTSRSTNRDGNFHKPYSPATAAIGYVIQKKHARDNHEEFTGPPSDASFKAWAELVSPGQILVPHEEMLLAQEHPENATEFAGGGYIGALGIYHELHCMRRLKLFLYRDYYYPNLSDSEEAYEVGHLDHCLEVLRISLMCAGNIALYTFQWDREETRKPIIKTNSERVCVDWARLESWSRERSIGGSPSLLAPHWESDS